MQYAFCTSYNLNTFCSNFIFLFWEDNYCDSLWSSSTSDIFLLRHEQEFDMLTNSFDPFWVSWTCREGDQVSVLTPLARVTSVRPFSCENTAAKEHAKHKRAPWTHLPPSLCLFTRTTRHLDIVSRHEILVRFISLVWKRFIRFLSFMLIPTEIHPIS